MTTTTYGVAFTTEALKVSTTQLPETHSISVSQFDPPQRGDILYLGDPNAPVPFRVLERQHNFKPNGDCHITLVLDLPPMPPQND